ncbi:thymocyte nuclear protein 1 [Panicum miliaceum]|uniref:Thymocyte nuclear protein 1 n=1 Tax=Panicum miliaceum TaxID=4540 RepID=A0A3L6RRM2_PANMI|nr:thymocyte nuclear protein 1 [Panicum miliaceum]
MPAGRQRGQRALCHRNRHLRWGILRAAHPGVTASMPNSCPPADGAPHAVAPIQPGASHTRRLRTLRIREVPIRDGDSGDQRPRTLYKWEGDGEGKDAAAGGAVDVRAVGEFRSPVPLGERKKAAGEVEGMRDFALLRQPRLSVMPVPTKVWDWLCDAGGDFVQDGEAEEGEEVFSIRDAAANNLKRLAEEFDPEWAMQHIIPQVSTVLSKRTPYYAIEYAKVY